MLRAGTRSKSLECHIWRSAWLAFVEWIVCHTTDLWPVNQHRTHTSDIFVKTLVSSSRFSGVMKKVMIGSRRFASGFFSEKPLFFHSLDEYGVVVACFLSTPKLHRFFLILLISSSRMIVWAKHRIMISKLGDEYVLLRCHLLPHAPSPPAFTVFHSLRLHSNFSFSPITSRGKPLNR